MNQVQIAEFDKILKLFSMKNCLKDVLVIGSWAEFLYQYGDIIPADVTILQTFDVDFLVRNARKPSPSINLPVLAMANGFSVDKDVLLGTTKIFSSSGLEMEFLIGQKGSGIEPVLKTALGVNAQALRHMDVLLNNTIEIAYNGETVVVPVPEAYVLHKMIINEERVGGKQEKDVEKIKSLFPYLNETSFANIRKSLTKKEEAQVGAFIEKNNIKYYGPEIKDRL